MITVTAQRREERSVDVPISIASLSGDTLRNAGVAATSALPQAVPGLRFDYSGSYVQPTIRGVGSALAGPGMNSNVAIYVDGFYVPNLLGSDFDLVSVPERGRVERSARHAVRSQCHGWRHSRYDARSFG